MRRIASCKCSVKQIWIKPGTSLLNFLNFTLILLIIIILNSHVQIIHAQADYMAPGVPYNATCYNSNKLKFKASIQAPNTLQVGQSDTAKIFIQNNNNKNVKVSDITIKLQYSKDLLNINNITLNKNICKTSNSNLINNTSELGTLYITLPETACGDINMPANSSTKIAEFYITAQKPGQAYLKIDTQDTSNGSHLIIKSPTANKANLINTEQFNISIIQAGQTTPNPTISTSQVPTTPPNTGIFDNQNTLYIIIGILISGIIIQSIPLKHKIRPIEYVEE